LKKKIGILFDMDGVIINNHTFHFKAWAQIFKENNKVLTTEDYRENMNGRTLSELVSYIFGEQLSLEKTKEIGLYKEELYRKFYQPYLAPTEGLLPFLSQLNAEGIPMVIGTSAPKENVNFTLDGLGIRHYFPHVLDDRSVTKGKPHPEIYQKCAAAVGLPNEQCIVFEDAISGLKAGKAANSKTIALATSHFRAELAADLIIDDFTQINIEQLYSLFEN